MTEPKDSTHSHPDSLIRQVADDFLQRCRQGEIPDIEEYARRHPEIAEFIRVLVPVFEVIGTRVTPSDEGLRDPINDRDNTPETGVDPDTTAPQGQDSLSVESPPGYEILEEVGRGGMGVVYRARQIGLGRIVALKMIRSGTLAEEVERERFRAEALAVARLQHPNVVQIFEVGEHKGLPFFSLEFVEGGSLAEHLKGEPQPPRVAAEQVEVLAKAMQAVHGCGLIHRDLKPANVLIASSHTLKITDFGLVKQQNEPGMTRSGAIVGTPSYLAPEQAWGESNQVGPTADVYALGAILYAMLTGRPPFKGTNTPETLIQVRDQEPVSPRQLQPKCPKDLETICLKCLEKDPARRYESVGALAEDLRAYLDGKPITARPIGPVGRAWRFCRRNPLASGLTALAASALIAGTAVSTYFAVEENRRAEELSRALDQGKRSIDDYVDAVLEEQMLADARFQPLRKQLLAGALTYYQQFIRDHEHDPEAREELAEAVRRVAEISGRSGMTKEAIAAYRQTAELFEQLREEAPSVERSEQLAKIYNKLGELYIPTPEPDSVVLEAHGRALAIFQRLAADYPDEPRYQNAIAETHGRIGIAYVNRRKPGPALQEWETARKIQETLIIDHPELAYRAGLANTLGNISNLLARTGRSEQALPVVQQLKGIARSLTAEDEANESYRALLANVLQTAGFVYSEVGNDEESLSTIQEFAKVAGRLARENPTVESYQSLLGSAYNALAFAHMNHKEWDKALPAIREAGMICRQLLRLDPENIRYLGRAAISLTNEGEILRRMGRFEEALTHFTEGIKEAEIALDEQKNDTYVRDFLRRAYSGKALALGDLGRLPEAAVAWDDALRYADEPLRTPLRCDKALCLARMGRHGQATSQAVEATSGPQVRGTVLFKAVLVHALSMRAVLEDESLDEGERTKKAVEYSDTGWRLLRRAYRQGYFDNLVPLRNWLD